MERIARHSRDTFCLLEKKIPGKDITGEKKIIYTHSWIDKCADQI